MSQLDAAERATRSMAARSWERVVNTPLCAAGWASGGGECSGRGGGDDAGSGGNGGGALQEGRGSAISSSRSSAVKLDVQSTTWSSRFTLVQPISERGAHCATKPLTAVTPATASCT